jgi:hypothetical protein
VGKESIFPATEQTAIQLLIHIMSQNHRENHPTGIFKFINFDDCPNLGTTKELSPRPINAKDDGVNAR